jgi:hypothetical protein
MKYFYLSAIIFCLYSCKPGNKLSADIVTPVKADNLSPQTTNPKKTAWIYTEEENKGISGKKYSADIVANELLQFDFPHDGGSTVTLRIDKTRNETKALISISKGQFSAGIEGADVNIGFDDGQFQAFKVSSASDSGEAIITINDVKSLIKRLKSAKKMTIRADFYDAGSRKMTFDVAGFKWER